MPTAVPYTRRKWDSWLVGRIGHIKGSTVWTCHPPPLTKPLLLSPLQSRAGAARRKDALPAAKPSPLISKRSLFTSFPAATSCVARAWPRSRSLYHRYCAGAAKGRLPRTTSGGFTSEPSAAGACREDENKEPLLFPVSVSIRRRTKAFGELAR